jgi:UDPglucose 6-dehydrogenase
MSVQVNITIVGSGYVGLVAAACFAELGHKVVCVDKDESKIATLRAGKVPIHEELLPELLKKHLGSKLQFSTDLKDACRHAEAIFVAVGTPQDTSGRADLSYIDAVANEISKSVDGYKLIIEKSTVPVFTSEWIARILLRNGVPRSRFDVASNPEFLREGTAVRDFLVPDRIVIGSDSDRAVELSQRIYAPLTSGEYYRRSDAIARPSPTDPTARLVVTSTKSAELIKHSSNAFLAMKISFINNVANMCEAAGADVDEVAMGMGLDTRIGGKFLNAGIGYGGSCFPKDVAAFRHAAEQLGIDFGLLEQVQAINDQQQKRFVSKIASALWTLRGKRLGVLGLAFKGGTDDIRDSPAISIIELLLAEGAEIQAYDPAATDRARATLSASPSLRYAASAREAAQDADALLILTNWDEFAQLDLAELRTALHYPIVIDGRNVFSLHAMAAAGFDYLSVGRPPVYGAAASTEAVQQLPAVSGESSPRRAVPKTKSPVRVEIAHA